MRIMATTNRAGMEDPAQQACETSDTLRQDVRSLWQLQHVLGDLCTRIILSCSAVKTGSVVSALPGGPLRWDNGQHAGWVDDQVLVRSCCQGRKDASVAVQAAQGYLHR